MQTLITHELFTEAEVKQIIQRRTEFEYKVQRRTPSKSDYVMYLQYELALHNLKKARMERKGINFIKITALGTRRLHFLFQRALRRFRGDTTLWTRYLEFCIEAKSRVTLTKTFGKVLHLHPTKTQFWIMAARWAKECGNMKNCRALLLRSIRINPHEQDLWLEYLGAELDYYSTMKEKSGKSSCESSIQLNISIPDADIKPEESDEDEMGQKQQEQQEKDNGPHLTGEFLSGAIPLAVYKSAIAAVPNKLEFRAAILDLLDRFPATPAALIKEVRDDVLSSFPGSAKALGLVATWRCTHESIADGLAFLDLALKESPNNTELWEEYANVLLKLEFFQQDEKRSQLLLDLFERCRKQKALTETLCERWVVLLEGKGRKEEAAKVAAAATAQFPASQKLWAQRIALAVGTGTGVIN
eukprot:TRINITY_DN3293_c0_g1_i3.p1 TRINITY_DN3293_c0_g1~~TRINITY_DN3293_c0_g1_i3.p1  ORF type:complete len:440 (-),score=129.01 TRINITY_DN3293_c0_g1_i3:1414-2658(-)